MESGRRAAAAVGARGIGSLFAACKTIQAADVARREGLSLQQRGGRAWACCPLHDEKTPSLCFYDDGGWHCFGCGRGGDAVAFYASLHSIKPLEAARKLAGMFGMNAAAGGTGTSQRTYLPTPPAPTKQLKELVDSWFSGEWNRACNLLHRANALIARENPLQTEDARIWGLVAAQAAAQMRLDELDSLREAGFRELVIKMNEEGTYEHKTTPPC